MLRKLAAALLLAALQVPSAIALAREGAPCAMCSDHCCCGPQGKRLASISRCPKGDTAAVPSSPELPALPIEARVLSAPLAPESSAAATAERPAIPGFRRPPDRPPRVA
jgi:hypothetical protein